MVRVFTPLAIVAILALSGCSGTPEESLRKELRLKTSGVIQLPAGIIEITTPLELTAGSHDLEMVGNGTLIKATSRFRGAAMIVVKGARHIRLRDFSLDGERNTLAKPVEMVPPENALRVWYDNNGVLVDETDDIEMVNLKFANVVNFAIIASRSSKVRIRGATVEDSGSRNKLGRNNLSGGILIEEGTKDFEVTNSDFKRILGNGLWTHSLRTSPRLENGLFFGNRFDTIGRDALQVGHATKVRVEKNTGTKIGYPVEIVDVENGGTPVGIDTAGNVDQSQYLSNTFDEINGKCMDLDGFHDGQVKDNQCLNRLRPDDYAFGHFGIVMNNTDPSVLVRNIELTGNVIDGTKYGGLFLMGSGHHVTGNRFNHLNTSKCPDSKAKFACVYAVEEPKMLQAGIYLGRGVARMESVTGNIIRDNEFIGHRMKANCIVAGPGVSLASNTIGKNDCSDEIERK